MTAGVGVFAGVLIRRAVAAQCDAAFLTGSQVNPLRADLYALGAFANFRLLDGFNPVEMQTAAIAHDDLPLLTVAIRS